MEASSWGVEVILNGGSVRGVGKLALEIKIVSALLSSWDDTLYRGGVEEGREEGSWRRLSARSRARKRGQTNNMI